MLLALGLNKFSQKLNRYFPKYSEQTLRSILYAIVWVEYNYREEEEQPQLDTIEEISPLKRDPDSFFDQKDLELKLSPKQKSMNAATTDKPSASNLQKNKKKKKKITFKSMKNL